MVDRRERFAGGADNASGYYNAQDRGAMHRQCDGHAVCSNRQGVVKSCWQAVQAVNVVVKGGCLPIELPLRPVNPIGEMQSLK